MAINERVITGTTAAAGNGGAGSGNQEEGLILHLDANDVDSYDGDGSVWYDITNHEYKPATNVSEHFNTVTYTGNSSSNAITGVGFQPDLVWIKRRNATASHYLNDSVRGTTGYLLSDTTNAETPSSTFTSFDSDGFTLASSNLGNNSAGTYVAWCFKAGGAAVSNTDGTTTSQVSANQDLGFSIVKHTGTGSNTSIGHGLGIAPELIITKNTIDSSNWSVSGSVGGLVYGTNKLVLQTTAAIANDSNEVLSANGTTFTVGSSGATNGSGDDTIHYCFASKRGVSKVGSYTGTGAAGNKVYTGFEPAWILVKKTNGTGSWEIIDNKRGGNKKLYPNLSNDEYTSSQTIEFNRDGFTLDGTGANASGSNYIYLAFAKDTNETSLIPDTDLELHLDAASFPQKGESGYSNTPTTWTALTGSNATLNNGILFDSELGNYLHLDGDNDTITTSNSYGYVNQTWEFWISPDTIERAYLWTNYGTGTIPEGAAYLEMTSTGTIEAGIRDGGSTVSNTSSTSLSAGKWYHIVITSDGSNFKLYINGESEGSSSISITSVASNSQNLVFGYDPRNIRLWFDGKIGQTRIYSSALSADEVLQNYVATKNDYPNGYNGTINGATWNSSGYFDFDGSNDIVKNTSLGNFFRGKTTLSISAWFKTSASGRFTITSFSATGDASTDLWLGLVSGENTIGLRNVNDGTNSLQFDDSGGSSVRDGNWHHVVFTADSGGTDLYVDGNELTGFTYQFGSSSTNIVMPNDLNQFAIGANTDSGGDQWFMNGEISKVKLYDKALTQAEVTALYNEGE